MPHVWHGSAARPRRARDTFRLACWPSDRGKRANLLQRQARGASRGFEATRRESDGERRVLSPRQPSSRSCTPSRLSASSRRCCSPGLWEGDAMPADLGNPSFVAPDFLARLVSFSQCPVRAAERVHLVLYSGLRCQHPESRPSPSPPILSHPSTLTKIMAMGPSSLTLRLVSFACCTLSSSPQPA